MQIMNCIDTVTKTQDIRFIYKVRIYQGNFGSHTPKLLNSKAHSCINSNDILKRHTHRSSDFKCDKPLG